MAKNIFVPVVGQFTNVGDAMHRRELLSWLKKVGTLHVFVGGAPTSFIEALDLPPNAKIYTNLLSWLWNLMLSPHKRTHFVFNPGEITVGSRRLVFESLLLPFEWLVKIKKGKVLRVGIAAVSNAKVKNKWIWRFLLKQSDKIYWRTIDSKELFGLGEVIPDLAFFTPKLTASEEIRDTLVLSMRDDRPIPSQMWINTVKLFAVNNNLKIAVVSQVRMDNERGMFLAEKLGAEKFLWDENIGHIKQEEIVREVYKNTRLVVSDRLHVLIAAITNGALPSVILTKPSDKIKDHFDVVEIENISYISSSQQQMLGFLNGQIDRTKEIHSKVYAAQERLKKIREEVLMILK